MPTTAERHALLFLAAVAVIGSGVRTVSARRFLQQIGDGERLRGTVAAPAGRNTSRGGAGAIGERALASQIAAIDSARAARATRASRPQSSTARSRASAATGAQSPPPLVDVNRASAAELERLPRVGPALAQRIIAWRTANGPFRSVEDLRHVRGIGPATAALLAQSVTF